MRIDLLCVVNKFIVCGIGDGLYLHAYCNIIWQAVTGCQLQGSMHMMSMWDVNHNTQYDNAVEWSSGLNTHIN